MKLITSTCIVCSEKQQISPRQEKITYKRCNVTYLRSDELKGYISKRVIWKSFEWRKKYMRH